MTDGSGRSARIVTLTVNPALDLVATAERVEPVRKIRTSGEHIDPGGGGINVARVIHELGGETLAVIAAGGVTGRYIEDLLDAEGVPRLAVPICGRTRISLSVLEQRSGLEYRFVPLGPTLTDSEQQALLGALEHVDAGWVVASGSLPPGVPADFYMSAARTAAQRGQQFALDTSGPALQSCLNGYGIDLVKPSLGELEALVGRSLSANTAIDEEAMALVRAGAAKMIVVTLGANGAVLATKDGTIRIRAPEQQAVSAVGAGDSFLAAMTLALTRGSPPHVALAWGVAAGTSSIATIGTARVRRADVEARYRALVGQI